MLSRLTLELREKDNKRLNYNMASLFHGALMELVDSQYAHRLHQDGLKPYSQSINLRENKIIWSIKTLNKESYEKIIPIFLEDGLKTISINKKNLDLEILNKNLVTRSYDDLVERYYFGENTRRIKIFFDNPTSFKSKGQYVFFPNTRLIFTSLINKFNAFSKVLNMQRQGLIDDFEDNIKIVAYRLRSNRFHLEKITIPSYMGELAIRINGPIPLINLTHFLLRFGEYSGIGIKTAIGMGAISLEEVAREGKDG